MTSKNREENFIDYIIKLIYSNGVLNRRICAVLRRADNPSTEYQAWEYLSRFVDLQHAECCAFALIAAAIAKDEISKDGYCGIGEAIARCYDNGRDSDQARNKMRRLLACSDRKEACRILRPLLSLIREKCSKPLDYRRLLSELVWFSPSETPAKWAQNFYVSTNGEKA